MMKAKKMTFLFFFIASSLGSTDGSLAEDLSFFEKTRITREKLEKEISPFVNTQFKRGREEKDPKKAWEIYLKIQEELPEELVQKDSETWEAARLIAWREMKELLEKNDRILSWAEPAEALFSQFYEKIIEDGILDFEEVLELTWLIAPHLPTKTGAKWYEKISDYFFENGNLSLAHSYLSQIKDYSIGYNDRIEKKLEMIEKRIALLLDEEVEPQEGWEILSGARISYAAAREGNVFPPVLSVKGRGNIQYQLTFQKSGLWDKELFLEISDSSVAELPRNDIRRKIYDFENALPQTIYLKRKGDKVILVSLAEGSLLVLDFQGTLLEKRAISDEIAVRYGLEKLADRLFPEQDFALIPAGSFLMGSPTAEKDRDLSDEIQHRVTLTQDFYIGKTEVTQGLSHRIMGETPSWFNQREYCPDDYNEELKICPNHPVEQVSWHDAHRFIEKLNKIQKKYRYRLPTEAEWEYAARGLFPQEWKKLIETGKSAPRYSFGDDIALLSKHGWYHEDYDGFARPTKFEHEIAPMLGGEDRKQTYAVASKIPNRFGLYDMHGNAWEWVEDFYDSRYGLTEDQLKEGVVNPLNDYKSYSSEPHVVRRGGSSTCSSPYQCLRSAYRGSLPLNKDENSTGFRVVRELREK